MKALKILKEHENEIKRRFGVKRIGIFGSHARGEETETSTVDVLVEFIAPSFDNLNMLNNVLLPSGALNQ